MYIKRSISLIASAIAILVMIYHLNLIEESYKDPELGALREFVSLFIYSRTTRIIMLVFLISAILVDRILNKRKFGFLNIVGNILAFLMLIHFYLQ
tara:strand:+ start:1457 stop:1744 length:288 start_codon:yes stop_codon:yes gene_type:complete